MWKFQFNYINVFKVNHKCFLFKLYSKVIFNKKIYNDLQFLDKTQ